MSEIKGESPNRQTILIVDDAEVNRELLRNIFSESYTVLEAENGSEALGIMQSASVDLVLLDIIMPLLDGYATLEKMHEDPVLSSIPVIVITSLDDEESLNHSLDQGAQDVIIKPFKPEVVLHSVKSALRRREAGRRIGRFEQLLRRADIDEKTGIYTKQAFCRTTGELLRANPDKDYLICRWDIDRFKVYNDTFGTGAGDRLLANIGRAYREKFSEYALTYGHLEADHFVACYERASFEEDAILRQREAFLTAANQNFGFVIRAGVYPVDDHSLDVSLMCD
ncbi:MAG: response regulator, partial [Oscillospiraceae bacterium]|nr:response regulator [Oscillospiraceae bacterium]